MEGLSGVLNIVDQYNLIYLKTINIREHIKHFEMVKNWLLENDKDTDNMFAKYKQINEILLFCVCDIEKITHKMIGALREDIVLSAVG